jgi:hypothetical protein
MNQKDNVLKRVLRSSALWRVGAIAPNTAIGAVARRPHPCSMHRCEEHLRTAGVRDACVLRAPRCFARVRDGNFVEIPTSPHKTTSKQLKITWLVTVWFACFARRRQSGRALVQPPSSHRIVDIVKGNALVCVCLLPFAALPTHTWCALNEQQWKLGYPSLPLSHLSASHTLCCTHTQTHARACTPTPTPSIHH